MSKMSRKLILLTSLFIIILFVNGCGRRDEVDPNQLPTIRITSYEGVDSLYVAQGNPIMPVTFRQTIYWEANDSDGKVEGYAFRVVHEDETTGERVPYTDDEGNPIGVPGYDVVDEDGWVYHYQQGADESIPLELTTQKTIWSDQVYAVINFPANVNGDSANVVSIFEVKCIDSEGDESESDYRYFNVNSHKPRCNVESSKGDISGSTIGTGITFSFNIVDPDQFVENVPNYFEFKLEKRNLLNELIEGEEGYEDIWWSTKDEDDVKSYFVSMDDEGGTRPALKLNNIVNGIVQDSTYIIARAVDLAGIVSEPDTVAFVVKEGFYPNTLIYNGIFQGEVGGTNKNDIVVLGNNHYVTQNPKDVILPSVVTTSGTRYAVPFWVDKDGNYSCIYSSNLKIYMHWGYSGEYETNDPYQKAKNVVYDENTFQQYFSEIKYYDLRLDGEPYYYAPLPASNNNIIDEATGKEWLRVPSTSSIFQKTILTNLAPGLHKFEVRAVDMQNEPDKTPSEFVFKIVEAIPSLEKQGILVIDDSRDHPLWSPEAIVDSLYSADYFLDFYSGQIDYIDRSWLKNNVWVNRNFTTDVISPTDLQNYKTVIYHSDHYEETNIQRDFNVLELYLQGGGNLILTGCSNIAFKALPGIISSNSSLFSRYFGIDTSEDDAIQYLNTQPNGNIKFYFEKAVSNLTPYEDIAITTDGFYSQITLPPSIFNPAALGAISYFPEEYLDLSSVEVLYKFGCVAPDDDPTSPTNAEYDYYSQQPVAIKNTASNGSKCYLIGFPLSYMNAEDVSKMLENVINDIEQ